MWLQPVANGGASPRPLVGELGGWEAPDPARRFPTPEPFYFTSDRHGWGGRSPVVSIFNLIMASTVSESYIQRFRF